MTTPTIHAKVTDFDLVKADKTTIDTQKVILKIWEHRNNQELTKDFAKVLSKFVDEKKVLQDVEFFLPQIAHLAIHLNETTKNEALELLVIMICQTSMHAALQFSFMFAAALEDYQPEVSSGSNNPSSNPILFRRCARLLENVERAVIYGSQTISTSEKVILQRRYSGDQKVLDSNDLKTVKREEIAQSMVRQHSYGDSGQLNGDLFYKRIERKSALHTKPWKSRYFVVEQRILYCYREPHSINPIRTMHLQNCRVNSSEHSLKYGDTIFEVVNDATGGKFLLRAENPERRKAWIDCLESQINGAPPVFTEDDETSDRNPSPLRKTIPAISEGEMSPIQRKRFCYFRQIRIFVTNLTNLAERLRFKDRPVRKHFLRHDLGELVIPPFAYIPLCSSSDPFRSILRAVPKESVAFNTKARCPALMIFEVEQHHQDADIASFLASELEKYSESEVIQSGLGLVEACPENDTTDVPDQDDATAAAGTDAGVIQERRPTKFSEFSRSSQYWSEQGAGLQRLREEDIELNMKVHRSAPAPAADTASGTEPTKETNGVLGETFAGKAVRLQPISPYGHLDKWGIGGLIAKSNDDVRQEVFIMQMIGFYKKIFQEANIPVWILTYRIMSTSKTTGLIELIPDSTSIDGLKKKPDFPGSLRAWYERSFGYQTDETKWKNAMEAYVSSMAGYSIICYLLAIKDRHNGNIMIDKDGHIIHIDFGFVFGLAPGKAASMEKAPWKLNQEMVDVFGGARSEYFTEYKNRCIQAFTLARKFAREAIALIEIIQYHSNFPAFKYNTNAVADFRSRLYLDTPDTNIGKVVEKLLRKSHGHTGTDLYDSFQLATNGIAK